MGGGKKRDKTKPPLFYLQRKVFFLVALFFNFYSPLFCFFFHTGTRPPPLWHPPLLLTYPLTPSGGVGVCGLRCKFKMDPFSLSLPLLFFPPPVGEPEMKKNRPTFIGSPNPHFPPTHQHHPAGGGFAPPPIEIPQKNCSQFQLTAWFLFTSKGGAPL